ncbi:MAG TPA: hypothetical protein VMS63_07090 [Gaiellaceae bacterium]|nr:hypothetical protein [Gaiellaceae bacterium]
MADDKSTVLYVGMYDDKDLALQDLEAFEQLREEEVIGDYDAAVIDKEDGKAHIVKRVDHPRTRAIPEFFGHGDLPKKELEEAAEELPGGMVELVVVGEPTVGKAFDKAVTRAAKVVKHDFNATTDELVKELMKATKE